MTSPRHYTVNEKKPDKFLPRDAMHSADNAVTRCPSVRLSVTRRYSVETAKEILKLYSPSGSHAILVISHQTTRQYSDEYPITGRRIQRDMKKSYF